jgi:RNA polymerase sigma factor (sigma-70 family)
MKHTLPDDDADNLYFENDTDVPAPDGAPDEKVDGVDDETTAPAARRTPRRASTGRRPVDFNLAFLVDRRLRESDPARADAEWEKFFYGYYDRLDDYFSFAVPDDDDRADLVQQVFVNAYKAISFSEHPLTSTAAAWSWLRMIGKNILRDGYDKADVTERTLSRHGEYARVDEELQRHETDVLERLALDDPFADGPWGIDRATFAERIGRVTDQDRKLLTLRFAHDLEWEEVAEAMGITAAAARKRFSRLTAFLRSAS